MDQNYYWFSISSTRFLWEEFSFTVLCCLCFDDKKTKGPEAELRKAEEEDHFTCAETLV